MRNEYNRLLLRTKTNAISTKVSECKMDTREIVQFHKISNRNNYIQPALPPNWGDEELANDFADLLHE